MDLFSSIYQNHQITFEVNSKNVMVNATEMAKIFGKLVADFMRLDTTKSFIEVCLNYGNSHNLNVTNKEDLVISNQKTGTWMHRVLALKFAAWLNPEFELWVYYTIDKLLFDHYSKVEESLDRSAKRKKRINELYSFFSKYPEFIELNKLESDEKKEARERMKALKNIRNHT